MEGRRGDGMDEGGAAFTERMNDVRIHETSKSAWYLFLLTVSIGGQVIPPFDSTQNAT